MLQLSRERERQILGFVLFCFWLAMLGQNVYQLIEHTLTNRVDTFPYFEVEGQHVAGIALTLFFMYYALKLSRGDPDAAGGLGCMVAAFAVGLLAPVLVGISMLVKWGQGGPSFGWKVWAALLTPSLPLFLVILRAYRLARDARPEAEEETPAQEVEEA